MGDYGWWGSDKRSSSCGNLVGDVKDHDDPASDFRIDIGDLRIDLIVDLLVAYRLVCQLAS
jgi:hypothetical protein